MIALSPLWIVFFYHKIIIIFQKYNYMKKIFFFFLAIVCGVGLIIWLFISNSKQQTEDAKLTVATTIFPLADITAMIGGDKVEVVNIVKPGSSPHTFELTPSNVKMLQGTKLIFAIGGQLDNWTSEILSFNDSVKLVIVDRGIEKKPFKFDHHHEDEEGHEHADEADDHHDEQGVEITDYDPHYWLSVENGKIIASNIAEILIEYDQENAVYYQNNLELYLKQLDQVKIEIQEELAGIQNNKLIVFHDSWNYFAREFGLDVVGVFLASPGKEPTPQQLADLYDTANRYKIKAVFSEPQLSPETLQPFMQDLGIELHVLDPLGGFNGRDSYINLLKYNAKTIKTALQ